MKKEKNMKVQQRLKRSFINVVSIANIAAILAAVMMLVIDIRYGKSLELYPDNHFFRQQHVRTLLAAENYEAAHDAAYAWVVKDSLSAMGYKYLGMACEGLASNDQTLFSRMSYSYHKAYLLNPHDGQTVAHLAAIYNAKENLP